jgi:hypothetical protein
MDCDVAQTTALNVTAISIMARARAYIAVLLFSRLVCGGATDCTRIN